MSRNKQPLAVALFVYNRPRQLERTLECLRAANPDLLYVFSDGPHDRRAQDQVGEVREIITRIDWVKVEIIERPENLGLSQSIQRGLDQVFHQNERAVIIEDDVCVSAEFLDYMRACLDRYGDSPEVAGVTGLRYPFNRNCFKAYDYDVFFAPRFSSWGWGTWRRFWRSLDFDHASIVRKLRSREPNMAGAGADLASMVNALTEGSLQGGWDVYCCVNILLNNQYFIWPTWNQIENFGLAEGTHAGQGLPRWKLAWERSYRRRVSDLRFPEKVVLNQVIMRRFLEFFVESVQSDPAAPSPHTRPSAVRAVLGRMRRRLFRPTVPASNPDPKVYSAVDSAGSYVPCQVEAYFLALNRYVDEGATVLDVGFGLGYGLNILSIKAKSVSGVDVDTKAYEYCRDTIQGRNPRLVQIETYDGYHLPFKDEEYDILTCVDVIEHVEDYDRLIREMLRVSRKGVFLSTPNRRPEYTNADGTPKNYWHLREWSFGEFDRICGRHGRVQWNFLNGPFEGPFTISGELRHDTLTLSPFIFK
jgi:2-polyprenyl-3-methyl-5-hydroxy-6-metoxy-1,4-benzoquinol methylase